MEIWWIAVVLLTALCAVDLVLTLGVVRRLRDHGDRLAELGEGSLGDPAIRESGGIVGDFAAVSVAGATVTSDRLVEPTLVGFFSPDCPGCADQLAPFAEYARRFRGGTDRTMAVVVADEDVDGTYVATLSEVATVIVEPALGEVQRALGVMGYPAFAIVEAKIVQASTTKVSRLPERQPA